jgi:hypothetical protein
MAANATNERVAATQMYNTQSQPGCASTKAAMSSSTLRHPKQPMRRLPAALACRCACAQAGARLACRNRAMRHRRMQTCWRKRRAKGSRLSQEGVGRASNQCTCLATITSHVAQTGRHSAASALLLKPRWHMRGTWVLTLPTRRKRRPRGMCRRRSAPLPRHALPCPLRRQP